MKLTPILLSAFFLCSVTAKVTPIEKECDFKAKIGSNKAVVCKFYAPWCGPCQKFAPVVKKLAEERKDLEFIEVSYEGAGDSKKLFDKYDVKSFPTIVVFNKGKEVGRIADSRLSKDQLAKEIDKSIKNIEVAKPRVVERLDEEAGLSPEDTKKIEALQKFMTALNGGNFDEIKKHITKESVNYVLESPMMDLNIIFLLIMNEIERADELIDYALSLNPDLTKELNIGGKKQTLKKHLDEMATALQKKLDLINKVGRKLTPCPANNKQLKK